MQSTTPVSRKVLSPDAYAEASRARVFGLLHHPNGFFDLVRRQARPAIAYRLNEHDRTQDVGEVALGLWHSNASGLLGGASYVVLEPQRLTAHLRLYMAVGSEA